jgi:hypothetical protein
MLEFWMKTEADKDDAPGFIEIINKIMAISIFQWNIDEIMVIKIKNWFDHKWLNYSGKKIIHFECLHPDNVAMADDWKERVTIPPFNPNRVLSEQFFRKRSTGNQQFEKVVHKKQRSTDNQLNQISRKTNNGIFVWYSSNSKDLNRGSLMMYRVQNKEVDTWYATVEKRERWEITQTKGIYKSELQGMIK